MAVHASSAEAEAPQNTGAAAEPWPARAKAWYTLVVLAIVLALSQIDRQIFGLLIEPIKRDLQLTDTQIGLLSGLAFSSAYLLLSLPLSRLSDSKNRKWMITIGISFWSLATAACGLAQTYWQMFLARAGIGAGEAVNGPATYSMLADNFPRQKLPRAIATLNLGYVVGAGLSLVIGGVVIAALASRPAFHLPVLGEVQNWQMVFFAVGLPGLLIAALMASVPEPTRRGLGAAAKADAVPLGEVLRFLGRNWMLYGPIFLGIFLNGVENAGTNAWRAPFFQRTYGWTPQQIGLVLGVVGLVTAPIGLFLGAWLTERWNRKYDDGNIRVAVLAYTISIPFAVAAPLMPLAELAVGCNAVAAMLALMGAPPLVAAIQSITPNRMRAQISSLYLIMFSGVTAIIGPVFMAGITDFVLRDESRLNIAMAGSAAVVCPIAAGVMWFALKPFGRAIAEIKRMEAEGKA